MTQLKEKIVAAQARIKELQMLIEHWQKQIREKE